MKKVLILGASTDPTRYSNMAMESLLRHGHQVVLVSPKYEEIDGHKCYPKLSEVKERVDAITMYVGAKISTPLAADIVRLAPKVVIFNPGSENEELYKALDESGIAHLEACTLVLLNTRQFEGIFP